MKAHTAILILSFSTAILSPVSIMAADLPVSEEVGVSASIGEPRLSLFGYGPIESQVKLLGTGLSESTFSNLVGYFEFNGIFLSTNSSDNGYYPEICIQGTDKKGASTQPTCIPPLKVGNSDYRVGPVTLSPTLILDNGKVLKGGQAKAYGSTTPNTPVELYFAREHAGSRFIQVVKDIYAYNIPIYQITSDSNGYFELNLPSDSPDKWRIFAAAKTLDASSPKSNTLVFNILPSFYLIIEALLRLILLIRPYLFYLLLALEIGIIIFLLSKDRRTIKGRGR